MTTAETKAFWEGVATTSSGKILLSQIAGEADIASMDFGENYTCVITLTDGKQYYITGVDMLDDDRISRVYINDGTTSRVVDCTYDGEGYLTAVGLVQVLDVKALGIPSPGGSLPDAECVSLYKTNDTTRRIAYYISGTPVYELKITVGLERDGTEWYFDEVSDALKALISETEILDYHATATFWDVMNESYSVDFAAYSGMDEGAINNVVRLFSEAGQLYLRSFDNGSIDGVATVTILYKTLAENRNIYKGDYITRAGITASGGIISVASNEACVAWAPVKHNARYRVTKRLGERFRVAFTEDAPAVGVAVDSFNSADSETYLEMESGDYSNYIVITYHVAADTYPEEDIRKTIRIVEI